MCPTSPREASGCSLTQVITQHFLTFQFTSAYLYFTQWTGLGVCQSSPLLEWVIVFNCVGIVINSGIVAKPPC